MKNLKIIIFFIPFVIYPWSGKESAENKNINFYGSIETYEGQTWDVQNIKFGRDREAARVKKIVMYDLPKDSTIDADNNRVLVTNPNAMSYSEIDLNEVDSIEVPHAAERWIFKEDAKKYGIEYREVRVTHKDGKKNSYLIELGREDIPHKTKLFCTVRHAHHKGEDLNIAKKIQLNSPESSKKYFVCEGVDIDELEEKGVPIQAIKKITIQGFCHQVLVQ